MLKYISFWFFFKCYSQVKKQERTVIWGKKCLGLTTCILNSAKGDSNVLPGFNTQEEKSLSTSQTVPTQSRCNNLLYVKSETKKNYIKKNK